MLTKFRLSCSCLLHVALSYQQSDLGLLRLGDDIGLLEVCRPVQSYLLSKNPNCTTFTDFA